MIHQIFMATALCAATLSWADGGFPKRNYKIDEKINPCENFYDYVCKDTISNFQLPKTRSRHNFSFDDTKEALLEYKKKYFKNLQTIQASSNKEQQIKSYYLACMNENAGKKSERNYVSTVIKKLDNVKTREQFIDLINNNLNSGSPNFISFWSGLPNFKNSEKMDGYFQVDLLTMPEKSYYSKNQATKDLKSLILKFFEDINSENAVEQANWVYDYEMGLSKVYPTSVEINKKVFSLTEHSKALSKKLKNIRLGEFIKKLPAKPHVRNLFGDETFIYVDNSLGQLSVDQLKSVYLYHILKDHLDDAYPEFQKQKISFNSKHFGKPSERPDRLERCTNEVSQKFEMELDSILMPKLFPNFPKEKLTAMVEKIRAGLIQSVEKNKWLSSKAKKSAILKLKHLNIRLVSPESEQEWNFNKETKYSETEPVENRILYIKMKFEKNIENFNVKFKDPTWYFGPLQVNAALLPPYNAIIFPIAILQPPFYDPQAPEEINMAAIGTVIGHELGHAIDDKGYTFDYKGRINPWIKKADEKQFFELAQPLIEQFDKIGHNGKFTLGENIGDLVGLTNAYGVAFPPGNQKPISLKKDFFIQYARLWCEVQKPEIAELRKKVDPHSFGFARTNEQVKHQSGFAEAFACKGTDAMVLPKEKAVRIW